MNIGKNIGLCVCVCVCMCMCVCPSCNEIVNSIVE